VRRKRWFVSKSETRRVERKKALRRMRRKQQRAMSQDGL
jgi:small subunit ribosomal protein S21